jgi:pSer/pThr/pTyr-binding forkhead associated (FHA) protein
MARLRLLGPDGRPRSTAWELGSGLTVGRVEECDVVLTDTLASRRHARVLPADQGFVLEDLDSANGTWIGEERVQRSSLEPGEPFRVGDTWLVLEDDGLLASPADAEPVAEGRSGLSQLALGCLGLVALVCLGGLGGAALWWHSNRTRVESAGAPVASPGGAAGAAGTAWSVASVPTGEADVLRFTLRASTNVVLRACAAMPADWTPPTLEVPLAARVGRDGSFRFERELSDSVGVQRVEGSGSWKEETLEISGRWTTRRGEGASQQTDEGSFKATGRRLLGTWFGDRLQASVASRLGAGPECRETIDNGYSRVDALAW